MLKNEEKKCTCDKCGAKHRRKKYKATIDIKVCAMLNALHNPNKKYTHVTQIAKADELHNFLSSSHNEPYKLINKLQEVSFVSMNKYYKINEQKIIEFMINVYGDKMNEWLIIWENCEWIRTPFGQALQNANDGNKITTFKKDNKFFTCLTPKNVPNQELEHIEKYLTLKNYIKL